MQKLIMKGLPVTGARSLSVTFLMIGPFNALPTDRQGIGYTPYYYERYMSNTPHVKIIAFNNLMPTHETISNGTYPIITEVVLAYLSDVPRESHTARIRDWLLTSEGQRIVAESGYISLKK